MKKALITIVALIVIFAVLYGLTLYADKGACESACAQEGMTNPELSYALTDDSSLPFIASDCYCTRDDGSIKKIWRVYYDQETGTYLNEKPS
ncbi:hypothetical protein JXB11_02470 [Candidatus Woesearchaeota archaeon]|nr:hypothetical protein [Candidatus Woesearchaeota archaeon]